jgi:hypothetical protein
LILEDSGPSRDQAAALDAQLFTRDPFPVVNLADLFNLGLDKNTRVMIFVSNLQLTQGETPASVIVNVTDSNNQTYNIPAEDVEPVAGFSFSQVVFRLPDNLPPGTCVIKVMAHNQITNQGTIRIRI